MRLRVSFTIGLAASGPLDPRRVHRRQGEVAGAFADLARSEGCFAKHLNKDGNPDEVLLAANEDRLRN